MSSNTQVLWGTNINTSDISIKLKEFLTTFMLDDQEDDQMDLGDGLPNNDNSPYLKPPVYI